MPDASLTLGGTGSLEVRTEARPSSGVLLAARQEVQRIPSLRAAFERARREGLTADQLAGSIIPDLETRLTQHSFEAIHEAAQYLADEYAQIGNAVLVIDRITGRAITKISDEDIWQPALVPRESGRMAQPLARLRPDLQGFIVSWIFNEHRDEAIRTAIAARLHQTTALAEDGDPRLLPVTRAGRAQIVENLRGMLPEILKNVQGSAKAFLNCFLVRETPPENPSYRALMRCTAHVQSRQGVQDARTFNLRHDRTLALQARIGTGWVREVARTFTLAAHREKAPLVSPEGTALPQGHWILPPEAQREAHDRSRVNPLIVVEGALSTLCTSGLLGCIIFHPESYELQAREIHDRWDVAAQVEFTLYANWDFVTPYVIEGIVPEVMGEIV